MRLSAARVTNYRSVFDTTEFEVEDDKTIVVGANEAGKTAVLRALQAVNPPEGQEPGIHALKDYPRSRYTEIDGGGTDPSDVVVAAATFTLDDDEVAALHEVDADIFADAKAFTLTRYLDNTRRWSLPGIRQCVAFRDISKDVTRLKAHVGKQGEEGQQLIVDLDTLLANARPATWIFGKVARDLDAWLDRALPVIDESNQQAEAQFDRIQAAARRPGLYQQAWQILIPRAPVFVYYSQFFTVRPRIHLANLAQRQASGEMDEEYDFGNLCLLELLGFTADELAKLDSQPAPTLPPNQQDHNAMADYRTREASWQEQRDARQYKLNAASVLLTGLISDVWGQTTCSSA